MDILTSSGAGGSDHGGPRCQLPQITWKDQTLSYEENTIEWYQKFNELISPFSIFSLLVYFGIFLLLLFPSRKIKIQMGSYFLLKQLKNNLKHSRTYLKWIKWEKLRTKDLIIDNGKGVWKRGTSEWVKQNVLW